MLNDVEAILDPVLLDDPLRLHPQLLRARHLDPLLSSAGINKLAGEIKSMAESSILDQPLVAQPRRREGNNLVDLGDRMIRLRSNRFHASQAVTEERELLIAGIEQPGGRTGNVEVRVADAFKGCPTRD